MSSPMARTHKEYQEFVKEQLKIRSLGIPAFFMDIYLKLINLDLSRANSIFFFKNGVFDSGIDYCWIIPIIKLNKRCEGKFKNRDLIFFTQDGTPIYLYGLTLTNWGYCWDRGRNKWRCPVCSLAQYKDEQCPYRNICQKERSKYGRVVYTRSEENYRYFTPVPRDSNFWKELYNKRGASERSFKSKKRDYKLSITRTKGCKMWTIRVALACMCQHIDAQAQILSFAKSGKLKEKLIPA